MSEFDEIFQKSLVLTKQGRSLKAPAPPGGRKQTGKVLTKQGRRLSAPKPPPMRRSMVDDATDEEFFKSGEAYCPTCGAESDVYVSKGGKKKLKHRGTMADRVGNEKDPHRGGKTGSFVEHNVRQGPAKVDRNHAAEPHAPRSGVVKAMFPTVDQVQLVEYTGLGDDSALAQQIEEGNLVTPPQRNLRMEQESGLAEE
jgi:hypothetical protein